MNNETNNMKKCRDALQRIFDSCHEGIDGSWDKSNHGLYAMSDDIETIADILNINLKPYISEELQNE